MASLWVGRVRGNQIGIIVGGLGLALTALAGCAGVPKNGVLPLGEWAGNGVFVYEEWKAGGPAGERRAKAGESAAGKATATLHRSYPTTLSLRSDKLEGRDIILMEIRSQRGELPGMDNETHLKIALVEGKRVSDTTMLYRAIAMQLNPKPDEKLEIEKDAPPFLASCTSMGDELVFQINYTDNFTDVFSFEGNEVEKAGMYFDEKAGLVHWTERLTRKK